MGELDLTILWAGTLRTARANADKTQAELAKLTGLSQQFISSCEAGLTRPSDENRIRIARALGRRVSDLFPYPGDETNGSEAA